MLSVSQKKLVYVGLSGGVDSAVSAALLLRAGYDVVGVFIKIVLPGYPCPAVRDRQEAMRVAAHLRIPFREIDLSQAYADKVFAYTLKEFAEGRTPNPDTLCNREIKFGLFYTYARELGADFVATGHYAQVSAKPDVQMYTSRDPDKDQTYFLWMVGTEQLRHVLFPVGSLHKHEVRVLAKKFKLPNAARKDSQGLCFLGDLSIQDMLKYELRPTKGVVCNELGEIIGTHAGVQLYTLGQRHGFLVEGESQTQKQPLFVVAKNISHNTITVSKHRFPQNATHTKVQLSQTNWIGKNAGGDCFARYRYRQKLIRAHLTVSSDDAQVLLLEPHYIPEGQSLVLYVLDTNIQKGKSVRCLGGGIVSGSQPICVDNSTQGN